jgi:hypothetical protein
MVVHYELGRMQKEVTSLLFNAVSQNSLGGFQRENSLFLGLKSKLGPPKFGMSVEYASLWGGT